LHPDLIKTPIVWALVISLWLHIFILFEVGFSLPDPGRLAKSLQPLEVVLVNSRANTRPDKADALAQHNQDGGGNVQEKRHAKTPLPVVADGKKFTPPQSAQRVQALEQQMKHLMTQLKSNTSVTPQQDTKPNTETDNGDAMVQKSLEIARLEAQIDKDFEAYQQLPRRRFIGARTREYRDAQYVEEWRAKVERIGNLNYPEAARQNRIFGKLVLTVSIRANGELENVAIDRSSGQSILDAAAIRIVKLAAPYARFPPDISRDTDIISITRTWTFTESDMLETEGGD
jgi:protein TonB